MAKPQVRSNWGDFFIKNPRNETADTEETHGNREIKTKFKIGEMD